MEVLELHEFLAQEKRGRGHRLDRPVGKTPSGQNSTIIVFYYSSYPVRRYIYISVYEYYAYINICLYVYKYVYIYIYDDMCLQR